MATINKKNIMDVRVNVTGTTSEIVDGKTVQKKVGEVKFKVRMTKEEIKNINSALVGINVPDDSGAARPLVGENGATVTVVVPSFMWTMWRTEMGESFPKIFGTITFDVDALEHIKSRDGKKNWIEASGFVPVAATGSKPYPDVDGLPSIDIRKKDTTGPATPPSNF